MDVIFTTLKAASVSPDMYVEQGFNDQKFT